MSMEGGRRNLQSQYWCVHYLRADILKEILTQDLRII